MSFLDILQRGLPVRIAPGKAELSDAAVRGGVQRCAPRKRPPVCWPATQSQRRSVQCHNTSEYCSSIYSIYSNHCS
jgi:hypothetical protein